MVLYKFFQLNPFLPYAKMAAIGHFQFVFLVIFIYNFLVWSPWYIEIYVGCIALGIWDMATVKRTRYVNERSWVRAPSGVCFFPPHKMSAVSRKFVCQPLQTDTQTHTQTDTHIHTYIHTYIYTPHTFIYDALFWRFYTWRPSMEYKMSQNIISYIKLNRVKLTQIHYDGATIFDSHGNYLAWS